MKQALVLLLLTTFALSAHAQAPTEPASADHLEDETLAETAKALYKEARQAYGRDDFATCYAKVRAALGIQQTAGTTGLRGDCALGLGKTVEAAYYLALSVTLLAPDASPRAVAHLKKRLEEAKAKLATVKVRTDPAEAKLLVDGSAPELVEGTVFLAAGTHRFQAEHPGREPAEQELVLAAGSEQSVVLALKPVLLDDGPDPNGGGHAEGGTGIHPAWPIATGALSAVGLGVAIALTVAANGEAANAEDLRNAIGSPSACPSPSASAACGELDDAVLSKDALHNAAVGVWIGTGVAAVSTVVLLFLLGDSSPAAEAGASSRFAFTPLLAPGTAGGSIGISF